MNRRRAGLGVVLLVLSHAAVFALAFRVERSSETTGQAAALPAKVREREDQPVRFQQLLRELESAPMSREEFEAARLELVRDWIKRDLRSAMDCLFQPRSSERYEDLAADVRDELRAEIAAQPGVVWSWIATRRFGSNTRDLALKWMDVMIGSKQADLVIEIMPAELDLVSSNIINSLCDGASAAQLAKIRELVFGSQGERLDPDSLRRYAERAATLADGDLAHLFDAERNPSIRLALASAWAERELQQLPAAEALLRVRQLPEDLQVRALRELAGSERRGGLAGSVEMLVAMDADHRLDELSAESTREIVAEALDQCRTWPLFALSASIRDLATIRRDELRCEALRQCGEIVEHGYPHFREVLDAAITLMPAGADRDAFLSAATATIPAGDMDLEKLLAAISDPAIVESTRKRLAEQEREAGE